MNYSYIIHNRHRIHLVNSMPICKYIFICIERFHQWGFRIPGGDVLEHAAPKQPGLLPLRLCAGAGTGGTGDPWHADVGHTTPWAVFGRPAAPNAELGKWRASHPELEQRSETHVCTTKYTHTYLPTYLHTYLPTYIHTYIIHTDIQAYRHTDIQAYRHTNIQTCRHADIETYRHTDMQT